MSKSTITCPQCSTHIDLGGIFKSMPETTVCPVCKTTIDVAAVIAKHDESKKGLISVIKYEGDNQTFVWKHPIEDFNMGSQLIVHESQEAVFFRDGQALDTFGAGRYTLDTQNLPLLRGLIALPTNADSVFHSEVYFVNKTVQMGVKWGTPDKVRFIDPLTGVPLALGASGEMNLQVADARRLLLKLVGTMNGIAWDDAAGFSRSLAASFRPLITSAVKTNLSAVITEHAIDILEIDTHLDMISESLKAKIEAGFAEYGLAIPQFYVTSIALPEDDPNFKRIRELHTITLQTRMIQAEATIKTVQAQSEAQYRTAEEQTKAAIEAAHREAVLQQQTTETEIAKREAERQIIAAQAEAQTMRMKGLTEAEVMQAKGYNQKDVLQAEVQKAYAAGIGEMGSGGGNAGSGLVSDIVGLGVGLAAAGNIAPQFGNLMQSSIPAAPTIAPSGWSCSCGAQNITTKFCPECGKPKPVPLTGWDCSCGAKNITSKFCPECGSPKPAPVTGWDCSCGAKSIMSKFCPECGSPKPAPAAGWDCSCGVKNITSKFCPECGEPKPASDC